MGGAFDAALYDLALREQRRLMGAHVRRREVFAIDPIERDLHAAMLDPERPVASKSDASATRDPAHRFPQFRSCGARTNALHDQQVRAIMRTETTRSIAFALDSRMDDFDIKLLRALQDDGRLTNNELADKVGLSASQCSRRRAALEASGVIASYHAMLSAEALGLDVLVFVQVTLATHSPENAQRFLTARRRAGRGAGGLFAHRRVPTTWSSCRCRPARSLAAARGCLPRPPLGGACALRHRA